MAKKPQQKVVVPLVRLDINPLDQADLVWRFTEADGEMGLRSNFTNEAHPTTDAWAAMAATPRAIRALSRKREIDRALEAVGPYIANTLKLVFGTPAIPELWPFGSSRNLLEHSSVIGDRHQAATRRNKKKFTIRQWLTRIAMRYARSATPHNTQVVDDLRRVTDGHLDWACYRYRQAAERGRGRWRAESLP